MSKLEQPVIPDVGEDRTSTARESEDRARRLAEPQTDAFVSFDENDLITAWTPEAERLFGWGETEALGRPFGETVLAPPYRHGHGFRVGRFLALGEQPLLGEWAELIGLHRDGHEFPIEIAEWGLEVDGGHRFNAFIVAIPVRRQAAELLQTTADGRSHFAAVPDLVILSAPDDTVIYVSAAVRAMLGWEPGQLVGTPLHALVHPGDHAAAELEVSALATGVAVTGECRLRRSGGSFIWTEFSRRAIRDPVTDEIIGARSAARDITRRLAVETERMARLEELRVSNTQLQEALVRETAVLAELREFDRMKSDFVAQVSHEVRTPLTCIVGYVELMLDGKGLELDPRHRQMLEAIERSTRRLTAWAEDLMTIGQIELDTFSMKPTLLDLAPIIELAAETVEGPATLKGIRVSIKVATTLGLVNADAFHIERVLLQLLLNAIKFTPAGGRINVSARRMDNQVSISVADTGVGMPVVEQDRIFDRFYRCERSVDDASQGAGVGLAIAEAVVERLGGSIGVESKPDEGTTMTVTLPTAPQAVLIAPHPTALRSKE
jgi:PAS domain S-box-containing protein